MDSHVVPFRPMARPNKAAVEVLTVATQNGWQNEFIVLGNGDMLTEPFFVTDGEGKRFGFWDVRWDKSYPPTVTRQRVKQLEQARLPIVQRVIAHEAPPLLPAPKKEWKAPDIPWEEIGKGLVTVTKTIAVSAAGIVGLTVAALAAGVVAALDPVYIVLVDNGDGTCTWVEIARWEA